MILIDIPSYLIPLQFGPVNVLYCIKKDLKQMQKFCVQDFSPRKLIAIITSESEYKVTKNNVV